MSRTIGIEIEVNGNYGNLAEVAINAVGGVNSGTYHRGIVGNEWTVKTDGTVNGPEIVSPPREFDSPQWRQELAALLPALAANGADPAGVGIHVHVDASGLTARQIAATLRFAYKFEDALYRLASDGGKMREAANTYATPIHESIAEHAYRIRTMDDLREMYDDTGGYRYRMVNLASFYVHGTIEFRIFNSSLNVESVQAFVAIAHAIVADAAAGHRRSIGRQYKLGEMAAQTGSAAAQLLRLQQIWTCYDRDTSAPMSHADWRRVRALWDRSTPQTAPLGWDGAAVPGGDYDDEEFDNDCRDEDCPCHREDY